jgi:hypothetical protein
MHHGIKSLEKLRLWREYRNLNPSPQWVNNEKGIPRKVLNTKPKEKCQREGLRSKWEQERNDVMHMEEHWRKFMQRNFEEREIDNIWSLKDPDKSEYAKRRRFI